MAGSQIACRDARPFRIKPCRGQLSENDSQPVNSDRCHVLQHHVSRSNHANDPHRLEEEAGPRALLDPLPSTARDGEVLAGEPSANNVSCSLLGAEGSDVVVDRDFRPPLSKDPLTEPISLDKPNSGETTYTCSGKGEASDAAEQIEKPEHPLRATPAPY